MPATKRTIEEQYASLCDQIWEHNYHYFVCNKPIISDYDFDQLMLRLVALEKEYPEIISPESPTQRVGEAVSGGLPVVTHSVPMLSLANTYSSEEVNDFFERMEKLLHKKEITYETELKMDGIAISVRYEEGKFVRALTRGNGREGEDVTSSVRTIHSLPLHLRGKFPAVLEARGEVFMSKEVFAALNREQEKAGKPPFANPRNAAGGSLKLLDPKEVAKRKLAISFYGLAEISEEKKESQFEMLQGLESLGLPIVGDFARCKSVDAIWDFIKKVENLRPGLPFEIDGVVIKVDDIHSQEKLGVTGKNYRWAIAYKFAAQQAETIVQEITVQVGRTGVLTPVAELDSVFVSGSTISRATLHNEDEVRKKDIRIGDTVIIEKGGDVIPKVVSVILSKRPPQSIPWTMPTQCPACGAPVIRSEEEVAVRCPNSMGCPAQELKRLIFFAGKSGMDIEHLGEKVVLQLVEMGFVKQMADIFRLKEEQLSQLKNFKEKSVSNLLATIEKSKVVALSRFLMALGIKHVGSETAQLLAQRAQSLEALALMSSEELMAIEGIGPKMAESIVTYFASLENQEEIAGLLESGVAPFVKTTTSFQQHPFQHKTFVLTGALHNYTRDMAASLIRERGGKISSSVSKSTDYLLAGEDPGSKYDKAKKLNVSILDEEEFIALL